MSGVDSEDQFDVQAPQITQWKKLLATAEAAFKMGDVLADEHEQDVLELCAKVEQLVLENDFSERGLARTQVYLKSYDTVAEVKLSLGAYFDFCNTERRHQSLCKRTPETL